MCIVSYSEGKQLACYAPPQGTEGFRKEARKSSPNLILRTPYKPVINICASSHSVSNRSDALKASVKD